MSFLTPLLLTGAAAVGLPIALHFLFKAWYKPLPWAAMDFLRKSLEQTTRRIKFRELLLLLLRCLALLLLALALARPILGFAGSDPGSESIDAVLVFDLSYSMGAKDGNSTRFEKAKEEALDLIDRLPNRSTVQVISCTDRAIPSTFTPSNLDQARNVVRNLKLTSQTCDLSLGLAEAESALDRVLGASKEIHVFGDYQSNSFDSRAGAKWTDLKSRAQVIFVRCGDTARAKALKNATIIDIKFPDTVPPHAGTRLPFTVLVKNTGPTVVTNVAVSLMVDGQDRVGEQLIDSGLAPEIAPGATYPVSMTASLPKAGFRLLTARIGLPSTDAGGRITATAAQPDDIPGDNRFDKLVFVRQVIDVLIVDGRPDERDPKASASHFLRNAIVPVGEREKDDYFIRATVVTTDRLSSERLGDFQIVALADVPARAEDKLGIPSLDAKTIDKLKAFVADGGGLIVGSGDFVIPESYNRWLGSGGAKLLPFDLGAVVAAKPEAPLHPVPESAEAGSFLNRMRTEPFSTAMADVEILKLLDIAAKPVADGGRMLMKLERDLPFISSKAVGKGEVIFVHTGFDATWTNWPAKPASYVGTVLFAVSHLTGKADRGGNRIAGEKFAIAPPDPAKDYDWVKPDGSRVRLAAASSADRALLSVTETAEAGEYRLQAPNVADDEAPRYAVVPDLREVESLDVLSDTDIASKCNGQPWIRAAGTEVDLVESIRSQREWTVPVLVAMLLIVLLEGIWAWNCGRSAS